MAAFELIIPIKCLSNRGLSITNVLQNSSSVGHAEDCTARQMRLAPRELDKLRLHQVGPGSMDQ